MTRGLVPSLGLRLDDRAAAERFHALVERAGADPRVDAILAFADGLPLAIDAAARAANAIGLHATTLALVRTVLGEAELSRRLAALWDAATEEQRALIELLSAWESSVHPARLVAEPQFSVAGVEGLAALGVLVVADHDAEERTMRLLRPVAAFARSRTSARWSIAAHARIMNEHALELVTQFEMSGDLAPLRKASPELSAVISRALEEPSLFAAGFAAVRAVGVIACFDCADRKLVSGVRELVRAARCAGERSVGFGHAALALALAERAGGNATLAAPLIEEALGIARVHAAPALEGRAERIRGASLIDAGRLQEALLSLERAVEASEEGGDDVHRSLALQWLALGLGRAGELERAIDALRETIETHRAYGNARCADEPAAGSARLDDQPGCADRRGRRRRARVWPASLRLEEKDRSSGGGAQARPRRGAVRRHGALSRADLARPSAAAWQWLPGARRPICAPHHEPGRRGCRMAGRGRRSRAVARNGAAAVAGGVLSLGSGARGPPPPTPPRRSVRASSRSGACGRAHRGGACAAREKIR